MRLPAKDPEHWLHRLHPDEWLRTAGGELQQARVALEQGQQRKGVTHARRAAGMALNAVLIVRPCEAWGRSYMDHLRALPSDGTVPERLHQAARQLLSAALEGPRLIQVGGRGDDGAAGAAADVLSWCEEEVRAALR